MPFGKLMNKSFAVRTLSGIILVIIASFTFIMGGDILLAFCFFISAAGLYELYHVLSFQKSLLAVAGYIAAIIYYILIRFSYEDYLMMYYVLMLMVFMSIFVFRFSDFKTEQVLLAYFGLIYVVTMISYIYKVRMLDDGNYLVWLIILCSWGCDTFAYLVGMMIGKHKLAPVLSPKKSVEGAIGGIIGAAILGVLYASIFKDHLTSIGSPMISIALICMIGAVISQIGDLAASGIKRNYELKDYGKIIPGHGGILDRFDSIIFTAPVIYFLTQYI